MSRARARSLFATLATLAVLLVSTTAAAEARAILTMVVNTVASGEATVLIEDADVLVMPRDLAAAGLVNLPPGRIEMRGGVAYRSLAALRPVLTYVVDERDLVLGITVPSRVFATKRVELGPKPPTDIAYRRDASGFLNYSFQLGDGFHFQEFSEAGLSIGGNLLYTSATTSTENGFVRGLTNFTFDDRPKLARFILGDAFVNTGALGGALTLGGVTLTRSWDLDPYFVRVPTLGYAGAVSTPSVLEIYLNGVLERRVPLAPGPFQLQNLQAPTGAGTVAYVIRDAFGAEHSVSSNYYVAPGVLRRGLSDYALSLGLVRSNLATKSFDYGEPGFLGRYRYAFTNSVTAGGRIELATNLVSAGFSSALALPVGELDLAASGSVARGGIGAAALVAYSYASRHGSVSVFAQGATARYATLSTSPADDREIVAVGASTSVPFGRRVGLSTQQVFSSYRDQGTTARSSALLTIQLSKRCALMLGAGRSKLPGLGASVDASATLSLTLGGNTGASFGTTYDGGQRELVASVNKPLPAGNGAGFRADVAAGDSMRANVVLAAQSPWGTYLANYQNVDGKQQHMLQLAGGIVAVKGAGLFLTRPVENGFAVIDVPGAAGVRGLLENQEIGRTGRDGMLVIPNMLPYYGNRVGIVDADLPPDYSVLSTEQVVAPPMRGGALVRFAAKRVRFFRGVLLVRRGGRDVVPAYGELTVGEKANAVVSPLGAHGEFELEGLEPGRYRGVATFAGGACDASISIPESDVAVKELGTIRCGVAGEKVHP